MLLSIIEPFGALTPQITATLREYLNACKWRQFICLGIVLIPRRKRGLRAFKKLSCHESLPRWTRQSKTPNWSAVDRWDRQSSQLRQLDYIDIFAAAAQ